MLMVTSGSFCGRKTVKFERKQDSNFSLSTESYFKNRHLANRKSEEIDSGRGFEKRTKLRNKNPGIAVTYFGAPCHILSQTPARP